MDASVNMKMTPSEHRLIVSALQEAHDNADVVARLRPDSEVTIGDIRAARERAVQLNDLLERL